MSKKLYCISLQISGKFPLGYHPMADERLSIEIGDSTLAYPNTVLRMTNDGRTEIQVQGWVVVCTNMNQQGLQIFLNRNLATVHMEEGSVGLEDVVTAVADYQILEVDLNAMNAQTADISFIGATND